MNERIQRAILEAERYSTTHHDSYSVPRETGEFLYLLAKATGAKNILELGTSIGHSGLWLGAAAQENKGTLTTVEALDEKILAASRHFQMAGLEKTIKIVKGNAKTIIPKLSGKFDLLFIDVWKEDYLACMKLVEPKLTKSALIVADNAISHGEDMQDFIKYMFTSGKYFSSIIPIGTGELMAVRK